MVIILTTWRDLMQIVVYKDVKMGERKGTKGLELWCRRMTEGYPGVNVVNMTTSWRDGLAFCAIIHHFRPDLIEFSKLNKDDIYHNNELAFRIAERHLGIPALLEPEDMVEYPVPDRLSILTYLSQFYQAFVVGQGKSPARIASKRPASSPEHDIVSPTSTSPPTKVAIPSVGKLRREPCAKCGHPVFIAERLNVGKLLYHRTCFRCARCNSQLSLANYYETENNEFCCETCPDEEKPIVNEEPDSSVLTRSLSDEEKSASLKKCGEIDDYSAKFENALEHSSDSLKRNTQYAKARSFFINSQVDDFHSDSGNEDEPPPDLPKTKPPINSEIVTEGLSSDSGFPTDQAKTDVNIPSSVSLSSASNKLEKSHDIVTKDTISAEGNTNSLVKARMRLFETKAETSNETNSVNNKVPLKDSISANIEVGLDNMEDVHSFDDNNILNKEISEQVPDKNDENSVIIIDSIITISDTLDEDSSPKMKSEETASSVEIIEISDDSSLKQSVELKIEPPTIEISEIVESKEESQENTSQSQPNQSEVLAKSEFLLSDDKIEEQAGTSSICKDDISLKNQEDDISLKNQEDDISLKNQEDDISLKNQGDYPDDLNPFGEEDEPQPKEEKKKSKTVNVSLNPFEDDEDDVPLAPSPKPAARKKLQPSPADRDISYVEKSLNPFDEDDENEEKVPEVPQPAKRKIIAPKVSLNPFWSDDEDKEQEEEERPVPKPRISKNSTGAPDPKLREVGLSSTFGSSSSSVASSQTSQTLKKKKPAPKPPMLSGTESGPSSLTSSPCHSVTHSPRATPKVRKSKKAPLPPPTSTPIENVIPPEVDVALGDDCEKEKSAKDEQNRNRQSQNFSLQSPSSSENSSSLGLPNKSTYGKWKRRKGQAPARPIPQRRTIKSLPIVEVKRELEVIEIQQQGLEKQGVRLEQIIREKCEGPDVNPDESLPPEIEEMVLQLFELVNEKNELFRRQAELMYLRRQHKLEEEHADIEYQIRLLMSQPEANKTDSDKAKEEELINRLVEIVERRNEIIECLEMDRVREAEEDDSINNQLNLYSLKKDEKSSEKKNLKKDKKKHKKEKKIKLKGHKVDADKDIDESETSMSPHKDKKKKKFAIF